jgi:hypothetical protein
MDSLQHLHVVSAADGQCSEPLVLILRTPLAAAVTTRQGLLVRYPKGGAREERPHLPWLRWPIEQSRGGRQVLGFP